MKTPIYTGLFQSDLDANGYRISGLLTPAASSDAATKGYVDAHPGGGSGGGGLDENTVTADDIGLVGDGVTDNTAIFQAWLDSVGVAKVNTTLLVPDGVYIFSGPLQDTSRRNAQILLPTVASTDPAYSITIKGYHPINFVAWPVGSGHFPVPKGPNFKSTLASGGGTRPAFIGGRGPIGGVGPEDNYLLVRLENMIFSTIPNPKISCLNFDHLSASELQGDVLIIASDGTSEDDTIQPTTSSSYGLIYPGVSYSIFHTAENLHVCNFYTGVLLGENCNMSIVESWFCINGFEMGFAYGVILLGTMSVGHCNNGLKITSGPIQMRIKLFNTEHTTTGWTTFVYDIVDPSNSATGDITWWQNTAFVGPGTNFVLNGGVNLTHQQVGGKTGSPFYVGTDARFTAVSGGVKLEVRNAGTGVWVEATRYTNP